MAEYMRRAVDLCMTLLLPVLMAYSLVGELLHEIAGMAMLLLAILHHVLNGGFFKGLRRGKYTPYRAVSTAIDLLLCVGMALLPLSGIVMSRHLFAFLPALPLQSTARTVHLLCAYWTFCLLCVHAGMHLDALFGRLKAWTLGGLAAIAAYGAVAFVRREIHAYLILRTQFVFFDFDAPLALFFSDYLAIMTLFATLGLLLARALRRIGKRA